MSAQGIRIASISGLRGVVGNGIDPVVAAEFAAAYASECEAGPIVVGHDGRVSAPVFMAAVQAAVAATGRDVLVAGAAATPTIGVLVRDRAAAGGIQISASHNPPTYNGLKFFQKAGMVLSQAQGKALLDRWQQRDFRLGELGFAGPNSPARRSRSFPSGAHVRNRGLGRDQAQRVQGSARRMPRRRRAAGDGHARCNGLPDGCAGGPARWPLRPSTRTDRSQSERVFVRRGGGRRSGRIRARPRRRPAGYRR